jgi:CBS domain-containing protein
MLAVGAAMRQDRGMQVKECMSAPVRVARTVDRLDAAARVMWDGDCGFCPVVDGSGQLVGVLTDRDLCMAAYTQGRSLGEIPVAAAMARTLRACRPEDTVAVALQTMAEIQVHRLPVIDARGMVVGVVSLSDLLRAAMARPAALDANAVLRTLAVVTAPRQAATSKPVLAANTAPVAAVPAVAEAAVAAEDAMAPVESRSAPKPANPVEAPSSTAKPATPKAAMPKKAAGKPAAVEAKGKNRRSRG